MAVFQNTARKKSQAAWLFSCPAAFSLVEMLMALLVASLLMAALAPVITKHFGENINVAGATGGGRAPAAMRCYTYSDTNPTVEMPLDDVWYANFIIASAGGGGGGASKENEEDFYPYVAGEGTTSKNLTNPIIITSNMALDSIDVSLVGGGGGGGGSAAFGTSSNTAVNKTEGGKTTTENPCPAGSSANNTSDQCVYCPSSDIAVHWNVANSACNALTLGGVPAGSWTLPTRAEMRNKWTATKPGNLPVASYWSREGYIHNQCTNYGRYAYYNVKFNGGTSWSGEDDIHCDLYGSMRYRCIIPWTFTVTVDTTVNYTENTASAALESFSAASGGSAPGFISLKSASPEAFSVLQEAIRNNPGGKIMLNAGGGGKAGSSKTSNITATGTTGATNGLKGSESCLSITEAEENNVIYKVCAKGGSLGTGLTTVSNVSNSSVSTAASPAQTSNGCYFTYQGTTKYFNCEGGLAGSNGTSSYKTDTLVTRDSVIYPSFTVTSTGTAGASGLSVPALTISGSSIPAGTGTYGAGGRGAGTQIGINSSGTITYTYTGADYAPTSGGAGFSRFVYKKKYDAAGGSGGGGGAVVQLTKLYVGKTAECTFTMGKGGSGGNSATAPGGAGSNGLDGGASVVSCSTFSEAYTVPGGKGGGGGISTTTTGKEATSGAAGKGAEVADSNIFKISPDSRVVKNGQDGERGESKENYFSGGNGGTSGTGTSGGCGALYHSEDGRCTFEDTILPTAEMLIGKGFPDYNEIIHPVEKNLASTPPSYGTAGAGGGGGGWYKNTGTGKGGDGMGGYVCVYWEKLE